jgi:hypothetical protein
MEKYKKYLLAIAAFLVALAGGAGGGQLLSGRNATSEITLFTTSTNANYSTDKVTNVESYRHIDITMAATAASGTLRFACSNSDTQPDFSAAASATNRWDYMEVIDKENGASIEGDTGITLSDTTDVRQFEINDNISTWCKPLLSGNTSPAGLGTTTVYFKSATNE